MDRERPPSNNRNGIDHDLHDDPENDGGAPSEDIEVEARLADWLEVNKVENTLPCATLYKFSGPTGEQKEQADYFKGIIPSRHEIGLEYGAGRYYMVIRNTTLARGSRCTSIRFTMHESYNERSLKFKRERVEKERLVLGQSNALPSTLPPAQTGKESLIEAFTLVRSMQADTLAMFKPILERILTPAAPVPALPAPRSPFEDYALSRQIMKDSLKESMNMMSLFQKSMLESRNDPSDPDDEENDLPAEKQSMFERIIALAEPFINILAQNNVSAKIAAAGIKAAPQFKEIIKDATLAKRIISYVEQKEGPERAGIALKNLGIAREDYNTPLRQSDLPPRLPAPPGREVHPPKKENRTPPPGKGIRPPEKKEGAKLNPAMEVRK